MRIAGVRGVSVVVLLVLVAAAQRAGGSVTASIVVSGSVQGSDTSTISVNFNGITELVTYDKTSTPQSIANAFAIMFSRNAYQYLGLCASANGNVINLKFKKSGFGFITIGNSNASFSLAPSGFPSTPPVWTRTFTLTTIGSTKTTIKSLAMAGTNAADFTLEGTDCLQYPKTPATAPGEHCYVTVGFTPTGTGPRTANLVVVSDAAYSTQMITLAGGQ